MANKGLIAATVIFIATSLGLTGYIVYDKFFSGSSGTDASSKDSILEKYGGFFRTPKEQEEFQKMFFKFVVSKSNIIPSSVDKEHTSQCDFECPGNMTLARKGKGRSSDDVYHGCCISTHMFMSPDTGMTADGQNVTLIQFGDDHRQNFPTQECSQAEGCTGCTCGQEQAFMQALEEEEDGDKVGVAYIKIPACCKCFNTQV